MSNSGTVYMEGTTPCPARMQDLLESLYLWADGKPNEVKYTPDLLQVALKDWYYEQKKLHYKDYFFMFPDEYRVFCVVSYYVNSKTYGFALQPTRHHIEVQFTKHIEHELNLLLMGNYYRPVKWFFGREILVLGQDSPTWTAIYDAKNSSIMSYHDYAPEILKPNNHLACIDQTINHAVDSASAFDDKYCVCEWLFPGLALKL